MRSRPEFSTLKRIVAILLALVVVLAAGAVIGQAPAIFGVDEDPEASIEFEDQQSDGTSVSVTSVSVSDGGFVVVTDSTGNSVGVSEYLEAGTHENVTINQTADDGLEMVGQLTATAHLDSTGDETYAYDETDGEEDQPYIEDGYPVSDTATVTIADRDNGGVSDSFSVESIDAPSSATTNETITVTAEIRNPTDEVDQQHVDLRIDGAVLERQVLELEPDESREIEFDIETTGAEPGEQTIGVYTTDDGAVDTIDLEFDGTPAVEPVDGNETSIAADVTTPADGFVAVEHADTDDANGPSPNGASDDTQTLGTSEDLSPGEYENVTIDLEDSISEDDELLLVLYEGDPNDVAGATQIETEDGEAVEAEFTLEELDGETDND
ncbi:CARDB domain-containing protein [Halostagnicola sp. A-GB9-2]|uniref:DUF7282 domain-containing protein n=1 Tax=Halostagnicola sp. A-GB9-2 TaxID=3048066 RepID=UPI0024C0BC8C|nr:CARDB domain-containing protein [Halostagnicola sp. A-GB9-2]MDJ1432656.1 CARDB domain-containing protein [Halostagnicola sp. A-GB9-2]